MNEPVSSKVLEEELAQKHHDQLLMGCCVDRKWLDKNPEHPDRAKVRGCEPETCMKLPDGATCGGCIHFERCRKLVGAKAESRICDFFPRRFVSKESV